MSAQEWKDRLAGSMPPDLADEIDLFEGQIALRRQGKMEDRVFAETRLRRGAYGQRYDNGQRHDGAATRTLTYPNSELTKGPETLWDAPGMLRIKIPYGGVTPDQRGRVGFAATAPDRNPDAGANTDRRAFGPDRLQQGIE